jgi:nitrogen fixation NifU-like protein
MARFLARIVGKSASEKHLPPWFFELPIGRQKYLLAALWLGDGYITPQVAKFVTISKQLAYQVKSLLVNQKIIFSFLEVAEKGIHKKNWCFYVRNDDALAKLAKIIGKNLDFPPRKIAPKRSWFDKNFYYVTVRKTKNVEYSGWVYNLEVKEIPSYVVGAATLHNCGDIMRLYIKVGKKNGKEYIKEAKFQTLGCGAAIATSSIITTMVKGKPLEEAEKISEKAIVEALGGLPPAKFHCSVLAADALKKAIENYRKKKSKIKIE